MASAVDQAGYIYVAGWAQNLPKKNTVVTDWVLRRSMDNGITWSVSDKFSLASGHPVSPLAMTVDLKGNIWVCGYTEQNDGTYPMHWIVRKGTPGANGTVTWAEVDNYQLVSGQHARANGITSDDAGNIYVSGRGNDSAGATFWIVRKLTAK
jgi:sugar lactone lactonase YvrE